MIHCITNNRGEFLIDLNRGCPSWSPSPVDAMESGHAWFASQVAAGRLRLLREQLPTTPLGLALVELTATAAGEWKATSARVWSVAALEQEKGYE